ncbi:MAG: hypothetical protein NTV21_10415, partial [Planctomycetota bacterium]|nr:hypothetical protein [Planctomycetota bacterium]
APDDARAIAAAALAAFPEVWIALAPGDYTGLVVMSPSPIASVARGSSRWSRRPSRGRAVP